jgi:membrane protein required for colicin V production
MNPFDAVIYAAAAMAAVLGFSSGLLRSLATILGYLIAAPLAVAVTPRVMALAPGLVPPGQTWLVPVGAFLLAALLVGALLRSAVSGFVGNEINLFDRVAGAALGALRIGLVAVVIVLVFDRIIPAGREPAFLTDSKLRPHLSAAAQMGLKSLPPEAEAYIDRLKRERGI